MKLKALLPAILLAAGIQGFAEVPIHFRDCVNTNQGGGKMEWPCVEGTREIDPETGAWTKNGDPLFDADGSITLKPYDNISAADGMYFRTTKLGTYLDAPIPSEYTFLALDYKSNMPAADMFVFYHEMGNHVSFTNFYPVIDTKGEYSTVYMILNRTTPADWAVQPGEEWGNNDNWKNNYMWIGWNDPSVKTPEFRFTVKNMRMLTAAEVITEINNAQAPKGAIADYLHPMNIPTDYDADMGEKICALTGPNNLFQTRCLTSIHPLDHKYFKFDYKAVGNADAPVFWTVQGGNLTGSKVGDPIKVVEDPYNADWSTYVIDLSELLNSSNYAQTPFSNDYMYLQFTNSDGNIMYVKNARWDTKEGEQEIPVYTHGFPAYFRDCVNMASDGGGHMDWPAIGREIDPETGAVTNWGDPAFAEDGSITLRPNLGAFGGGLYFRTVKFGKYENPQPLPADKVVFAFDYKSNKTASDMVFFHHEGGGISMANGNMIEITGDEYATTYMILSARGDWATENDEGWANRYAWVSWNDPNVHDTDWELTIKDLRYLSLAEAAEECAAVEGDVDDAFVCINSDITRDFDENMDGGCYIYSRAQDVPNPMLATNNHIKPLPATDKYFVFEYKLVGGEFAPRFHPVQAGGYSTHYTEAPKFIPLAEGVDPYEAAWQTYVMDFSDLRNPESFNFANVFGSNDQLHVQMVEMNEDDCIWLRNARWTAKSEYDGVDTVAVDNLNNAPVVYYNLMGVRVNNPSNGVFIRCQGNKVEKVLVK